MWWKNTFHYMHAFNSLYECIKQLILFMFLYNVNESYYISIKDLHRVISLIKFICVIVTVMMSFFPVTISLSAGSTWVDREVRGLLQ